LKPLLTKDNLHEYQIEGHDHIVNQPHAGLFLEMGLGKTVTTLTAIDTLIYADLAVDRVLVVAPKRIVESVWKQETEKWEHLRHLRVSRVIGTQKQRLSALKVDADIYLISRDNIAWLCNQYGGFKLPFDMLVIDESSSFKNHKSIRFKALKRIGFSRVVILTGTPTPNTLIDLWAQIYLLDKGERLGRNITEFRRRYFIPGASNGHIVYKYKAKKHAKEVIFNAISDICMSMKSEDYLKLPKRMDNFIEVKFPKKLQREYDDFAKELIYEIQMSQPEGAIEITAANAAALSGSGGYCRERQRTACIGRD